MHVAASHVIAGTPHQQYPSLLYFVLKQSLVTEYSQAFICFELYKVIDIYDRMVKVKRKAHLDSKSGQLVLVSGGKRKKGYYSTREVQNHRNQPFSPYLREQFP
jgi:hypothetical protein